MDCVLGYMLELRKHASIASTQFQQFIYIVIIRRSIK